MQNIFAKEFQPKSIIDNPSEKKLRAWALEQGGIITEFGNLSVVTAVRNRIAKFTEVVTGELDQEARELNESTGENYSRVVIDSLTALKLFSMEGEDRSILIQSFMQFLSEIEATSLLVTQPPNPNEMESEVLLARGEIRLHKWIYRNDTVKRGISIEKFRGSDFSDAVYPMEITEDGIVVKVKKHV